MAMWAAWMILTMTPSQVTADAKRVCVVINEASQESVEVGAYYMKKRGIPPAQLIRIKTTTDRKVSEGAFENEILAPLRATLAKMPHVDFIVMTRGVPIRILNEPDHGVDAQIAAHTLPKIISMSSNPKSDELIKAVSPYFGKEEKFSFKKFGFRLVTRLDGYTVEDSKRLVDNSLAAKAQKGPFVFDADPSKPNDRYNNLNGALDNAHKFVAGKGFKSTFDDSSVFLTPKEPLMGYVSWGSNDPKFSLSDYRAIKFLPGAIAETFVSTSARRFFDMQDDPNKQSVISDLIRGGVTGVKGYVSEPYSVALARPDILFHRYLSGYNLAESFYMASPFLKWKDCIVGDPLCAPYATGATKP